MFRALIPPIFRSTRLFVTACGIIHPRCCRTATSWVHYTTSCNIPSSAPEDGRNNRPKHVELIGIINKPLLLHLVGCLYYLNRCCIHTHIYIYTHTHTHTHIHTYTRTHTHTYTHTHTHTHTHTYIYIYTGVSTISLGVRMYVFT